MMNSAESWWIMATACLAGPLLVGGVAKLVAPAHRISWPVRGGPLRPPAGPKIVGAAELIAAAAVVVLPGRLSALVLAAAYAALTVAAVVTRGQPCACFGVARLAAVGRTHISLNAAAATGAAVLAATGVADATAPVPAGGAVLVSAAAMFTLVMLADRSRVDEPPGCPERVTSVRLYVSDDCPSCRSLKHLLTTLESERIGALQTIVVARDAELPPEVRALGVPCAQGLNAAGEPVCAPASGIGGVKALIDSITIPSTAVAHVG